MQISKERISKFIESEIDRLIEDIIEISQIPAPTFQEEDRANYIKDQLKELGVREVRIDEVGNVIGSYSIDEKSPVLMVAAHLDTVFSKETDLQVTRQDGKIFGPGVCDNSLGLKGLLFIAEILNEFDIEPDYNLILAATVGEEGLGNLQGMHQLMKNYEDDLDGIIILEGEGLGRITHQAVGSRRWEVKFKTEGGHSWHDFGQPSAVHTMAKTISALSEFDLSFSKETTFNIGKVSGGRSVNTIAPQAEMLLEIRSLKSDVLTKVENDFIEIIEDIAQKDNVDLNFELMGKRPAGEIPREHKLVELIRRIHQKMGIDSQFRSGSTDGNLPLSRKLPTVTIGLTKAANLHSEEEYMEVEPVKLGLEQLILILKKFGQIVKEA